MYYKDDFPRSDFTVLTLTTQIESETESRGFDWCNSRNESRDGGVVPGTQSFVTKSLLCIYQLLMYLFLN